MLIDGFGTGYEFLLRRMEAGFLEGSVLRAANEDEPRR